MKMKDVTNLNFYLPVINFVCGFSKSFMFIEGHVQKTGQGHRGE